MVIQFHNDFRGRWAVRTGAARPWTEKKNNLEGLPVDNRSSTSVAPTACNPIGPPRFFYSPHSNQPHS